MRPPPAVSVRCTGGWPWRLLRVGLPVLAAAVLAAWGALHAELPPPAVLALCLAGAVLATLPAWRRSRPQAAVLQWDGQRWVADGQAGQLQLMLDTGAGLLLRLLPEGQPARWLAVTANEAGAHWHALRAAVYWRPSLSPTGAARPQRTAD